MLNRKKIKQKKFRKKSQKKNAQKNAHLLFVTMRKTTGDSSI